jgi:soluble lytic murein transglycosylase-like protein
VTFWVSVVIAALIISIGYACGAEIPADANKYRRDLTRNAHMIWGLSAPVATFAAQIHQESGWRPDARSAYAYGLSQFTPGTAEWIGTLDPVLAWADAGNPVWALRALVRYDRWLWDRTTVASAATPCDRMAFSLSGYNGGIGYVIREQRLAASAGLAPDRWWQNVELTCVKSRAEWACEENRGYPRRILLRLEPVYARAGWGLGVGCAQ